MKLVFLFGNTAAGKMTVGQALTKITPLRLFHNHHMIEPVIEVFGGVRGDVVQRLREVVFEEFAKSDLYGLIFTYMFAFDRQSEWDYIAHVRSLFEARGAEVYYVELDAPQDVRLMRNRTENRLKNKPSKRDVAFSDQLLLNADRKYRCESLPGEVPFDNFLKIDNSALSPEETAKIIKDRFDL